MAKAPSSSRSRTTAHANPPGDANPPAGTPSHQIWLAGLGAMAQAQAQGTKAFEALVSDGLAFQRKSQAEAQQRLHEATERLTHLAQDFGQQASGRIDRLEHVFEDRVAKALQRLGIPSLHDLEQLNARVAALEARLDATPSAKSAKAVPVKSPGTRKAR